ncbi:hypothetical protein V6N13_058847 [Hibiscus sabdariffa]|uniref:Shugoshin C-terminal domain-containing protein n=1 Tax=Hibiscus sabdariffa TaxID=183260 RepID=A0ABR2GFC7_9ROSI
MGSEKMAKRSSSGNMVRKRLSDITNSQPQPKPPSQLEDPQEIYPVAEEDSINQLIMELNLGEKRVKALQHELECKDSLLKAQNQEKKGKVEMSSQNNSHGGQQGADEEDKHGAGNRTPNARSQSMGPSTTSQRGKIENKRRCLRRQSARENLFELDDIGFADTPLVSSSSSSITSMGRPLRKAAEKVQSYKEFPLNVKMRRAD